MLSLPASSLDKVIRLTRIPWYGFVILVGGALLLLGLATAFFDGIMDRVLYEGIWRPLLMAPAIVVYILAVFRPVTDYQERALNALRRIVRLDDEGFARLVDKSSKIDGRTEMLAFAVGGTFGFLTNAPWSISVDLFWLRLYMPLTSTLMFGLLAWLSYISLAGTRLFSELHQEEMNIDIFDLSPFEPIGRYALFSSLAFIGGSVISVIILNPLAEGANIISVILYGILAVVTLLVFFLNMRPTHAVLARAKARELKTAEREIAGTFRDLKGTEAGGADTGAISTRLNLWLRYEERVKKARTWPYNTPMLRALFFSVFVPAIVSIVQRLLGSILAR